MGAVNIADLEYLDEEFVEAEEPAGFSRVPDGDYVAAIDALRAEMTDDNYPRLGWEFVIQGGDYDGRRLFLNHTLKDKRNIGWLKKDLRACGVDIDAPEFRLSAFMAEESNLEELLDVLLDVTVKNRTYKAADGTEKQATNVYINGVAGDVDGTDDGDDGEVDGGDDALAPFDDNDPSVDNAKPLPRSTSTRSAGSADDNKRRTSSTPRRAGGGSSAAKANPFKE